MRDTIFHVLFVWYPYVCLSAFIFGSIIRFDREQYTWKASSSQLLRKGSCGSARTCSISESCSCCWPYGRPADADGDLHALHHAEQKQLIAITAGGIAGTVCFVGLTLLLHRRLTDARIRQTSTYMALAVLIILWSNSASG